MIAVVMVGAFALTGCHPPALSAPYGVHLLLSDNGTGQAYFRLDEQLPGSATTDLATAMGFTSVKGDPVGGLVQLSQVPESRVDVDVGGLLALLAEQGVTAESVFVSVCTPHRMGRVEARNMEVDHFGSCALFDGGTMSSRPAPHVSVRFEHRWHPAWPLGLGVVLAFAAGVVACELRRRHRAGEWGSFVQRTSVSLAPVACLLLSWRSVSAGTGTYFLTGMRFDEGLDGGFEDASLAGLIAAVLLLVIYAVRLTRRPNAESPAE